MSQDGRSQGGGGGGVGGCGGSGTSTNPQDSPITLSVPRPDHQRTSNLYVDTPFKHRVAPRASRPSHNHHHHSNNSSSTSSSFTSSGGRSHVVDLALVHGAPVRSSGKRPNKLSMTSSLMSPSGVITAAPLKGSSVGSPTTTTTSVSSSSSSPSSPTQQQSGGRQTPVISKQPQGALTFTKGRRDESENGESIICSWCGRCRCEACTKPRPPPAVWLCRNKCLCSPAAAVDYASCLCCVKGVLYHCGKDRENGLATAADHPCSCSGSHALLSWACLAAATIPLPCLLCYWPLTGIRKIVEETYQRCTSHGCRCPEGRHLPHLLQPPPPEKRPLTDCA